MGKILADRRDEIQAELAKELLKLAFQEMTKSKVILVFFRYAVHHVLSQKNWLMSLPVVRMKRCFVVLCFCRQIQHFS